MIKLTFRNTSFGFSKRPNYLLAMEITRMNRLDEIKAAVYGHLKAHGMIVDEYRQDGAGVVRSFVDLEFFDENTGGTSRDFWQLATPYNKDYYNILRVARHRWQQLMGENRNKLERAKTSWSVMAAALELQEINNGEPLRRIANSLLQDDRLAAVDNAAGVIGQAMTVLGKLKDANNLQDEHVTRR